MRINHVFLLSISCLILSSCTSTSPIQNQTESEPVQTTESIPIESSKQPTLPESESPSESKTLEIESQSTSEEENEITLESGNRYLIEKGVEYKVPVEDGYVTLCTDMQMFSGESIFQGELSLTKYMDKSLYLDEAFGSDNGWFLVEMSEGGSAYSNVNLIRIQKEYPDSFYFWNAYLFNLMEDRNYMNLVVEYDRVMAGGPLFESKESEYEILVENSAGIWKISLPDPVALSKKDTQLDIMMGREVMTDLTGTSISNRICVPDDKPLFTDKVDLYHSPSDENAFDQMSVYATYEVNRIFYPHMYCFIENGGVWTSDCVWIEITLQDGSKAWAKGWQLCGDSPNYTG